MESNASVINYTVSRCSTRGESEEKCSGKKRCKQEIHPGFETQGRHPKQGNHWPYKRTLLPLEIKKKKKERTRVFGI